MTAVELLDFDSPTGDPLNAQAFAFLRALWRKLPTKELEALAILAHLPPAIAERAEYELTAPEIERLLLACKRAVLLGTCCALALQGAR